MANSIIKKKSFTPAVVGQPYRAPRPARTGFEKRKVCGYKYTNAPGRYIWVTNDLTKETTGIWIPDDPSKPGKVSTYTCWEEEVEVSYPADPGQKAIAGKASREDYNLGWNAGGRSITSISGDGYASFKARPSVVGAICGLNGHEDTPVYNGQSILFAFYLTRGTAKVIERGAYKTSAFPYSNTTVFKISREGGQVTYLMDDAVVYTSAVGAGDAPSWLQAAIYSGDDEIFDPQLVQASPPDMEIVVTGKLTLTLPAPSIATLQGEGGVLRLRLPGLYPALSNGLAAPSYALLNLSLPAVYPQINALVGSVGTLTLSLAAPRAMFTDHATGRLSLALPPLWLGGTSWPHDTIPGDGPLITGGGAAPFGIVTLPTQPLGATLGGVISHYAEIILGTVTLAGILSGSIEAQGEVTFPVAPFVAALGGSIGGALPGLDEVFALNVTGGKPGGTTQYENYPFNSAARIGSRYYGASEDGLYLLEGDDDAGQPIEANFGFGQMDFGNPQLKTMSYCYLGASAGAMRLQIDTLAGSHPATYSYPSREHGRSMRELRFDLGRGLRSTYVIPTFYNSNGSPFEVDTVRFLVAESARRI